MRYTIFKFILFEFLFLISVSLKREKLRSILVKIMIIFYSFWLGYRDIGIGSDTKAYVFEYLKGEGGYFSELGFKYLSKILYKLNFNYQNYLTILIMISLFLYLYGYKIIIKNKKSYYLIYWCFLFNITALYGAVNGIRQFMAGSFLILAIGFYLNNQKNKSYIFFIVSFLFHKTTILFIFIYLKKLEKFYIKLNNKNKIYSILIILLVSLISIKILIVHPKIMSYFLLRIRKSFYLKYIFIFIIYLLFLEFGNKEERLKIGYVFWIMYLIISIFFSIQQASNRLLYYINIITPILVFNILQSKKINFNRNKIIIIFFMYHILILLYPSTAEQFKFKIDTNSFMIRFKNGI